jgi:cellulose biosynthesis protein BcsQ
MPFLSALIHPPLIAFALFAADMPTWTDKEVMRSVGSVVATLLTAGVSIVVYLLHRADKKAEAQANLGEAERQKRQRAFLGLQQKTEALEKEMDKKQRRVSVLEAFARDAIVKNGKLLDIKRQLEAFINRQEGLGVEKEKQANALRTQLDGVCAELKALNRRMEKALVRDGRTWAERVLVSAPDFVPLEPGRRQMPIIAVLNLKGGVGKTTITANLGAALDGMGYRVLLLDLDLQGSLTSLFLSEETQASLYRDRRLLGDFYAAFQNGSPSSLLTFAQPILDAGRSSLIPTTDQLTYAEMNLTIPWLLRQPGIRDPRFMLRRELHRETVTGKYDIVLLDCPPFINISCVNALAACDYTLVPIMPSKPATDRVPVLLERLKEFRANINSALHVLGIVANRTHREELTYDEVNRISALKEDCKRVWGVDIFPLRTTIRQNVDLRTAEDNRRPLTREDSMYRVFEALAHEVVGRLPRFCKAAVGEPVQVVETLS